MRTCEYARTARVFKSACTTLCVRSKKKVNVRGRPEHNGS